MAAPSIEYYSSFGQAGKKRIRSLSCDSEGDTRRRYPLHTKTYKNQRRSIGSFIKVKARVKDIDSFYIKNSKDPRIRYIYASRTILQKISEKTDNFEKMEESSMNENDWKVP